MVDKINHCIFCTILLQNKKILYNDGTCFIIADINPVGKIHLLTIPNKHIVNINYLTKQDIPLIEHMKYVSETYIKENYKNENDIMYVFLNKIRIS
jgi:diadenosine tetraphosphate (Ap4A) HIT family hydrolase